MLKLRIITALVLFALIGLCLFYFSPTVWIIFCSVLLSCTAFEWARFAQYGKLGQNLYIISTLCASYILLSWQGRYLVISWLYYGAAFFWCGIAPLWLKYKWRLGDYPWVAAICGWVIFLPAFDILYHARLSPLVTKKLLLTVMIVWIADSAAYFAGRAFGKRKLAPSISPGKSWEGVIGAMIGVSLYAFAAAYLAFPLTHPLSIACVILIACLLTAVSIVGDLLESLFKRQVGMKDSSGLLPGHGGVLDRLDSLLALLPFAGILLIWI
jgi:phosphatidate cytidylyltransferase